MNEPTPFHRLFGYSWADFFRDTDVTVELEVDLSLKHQFLDLVLIRKGNDPLPRRLPDGFDELAPHNLVTFKSHQEALEGWSLEELIGHYANYRKQASPSMDSLLPKYDFRMYAVCVRVPQELSRTGCLQPVQPGVYDVVLPWGTRIRVIVVHQLPFEEQNAMLHLFAARAEAVRYANDHWRPRSNDSSSLLYQLLDAYQGDPEMAVKLEEYVRQTLDEIMKQPPIRKRFVGTLTPQERLEGLSPRERLEGVSPQERLEGVSPQERLDGLTPDQLRALVADALRRVGASDTSSGSTDSSPAPESQP